jgi:hypothetical protein
VSTLDSFVEWCGARLREPSTYAGVGVLLGAVFHVANADGWAAAIMSIGIGVGGIIAILLPEKGK